ncbi:DeoR/GlpR transcriptional regulator [Corynebacterium incognita]|uniref:Lactose phosphotransferase system repressor n=1 Tax=Corynebacterium incognita TaxID=2754725 RepID=A0A7G7CQ44_9CORY|nr:DeoR/GlpR family DNA-binding transcription regulator [Corynebacterium incognita]QNE89710.1 DeoR/GlpR transcriptional regulator [Corynebacterium incognita]
MYADERRRQIASLTAVEGRVNVSELARHFDVTPETIRRDLAALDDSGMLHRVHGGAVAAQNFHTAEEALDARLRSAPQAKAAIAEAALSFLPEAGGSIFLDAGSTVHSFASLIRLNNAASGLSVVSNSLPIALSLANVPDTTVQLLGGTVRALTQAVVGDIALRTMALLRADVAFLGTNAITLDNGLSTADPQEAAIKTTMVTNARKVVVLCDATKLGNDFLVNFASLDDVDVIITDSTAPTSFVQELRDKGIEVVVADPRAASYTILSDPISVHTIEARRLPR